MDKGILVYHIGTIMKAYIRLFDLVAWGNLPYPYYHHDLEVLNAALNEEFSKRINELNKMLSDEKKIDSEVPYSNFVIEEVHKSWFKVIRQKFKMREFEIKMAQQVGGETVLPQEALTFNHHIDRMIETYELSKYKFEAEQFKKFFDQQQENIKAKNALDKDFDIAFIGNADVRVIVSQYFEEFKTTYFSEAIRAPIILIGAIIEALLTEALKKDQEGAESEYKKQKSEKKEISKWRFEEIIDISIEMGIIPKELENQTDMLRNFRNYVHIHRAVKSGIQLDNHYKELCKNALFIILKEVRNWYKKRDVVNES
jgi:hypothetical protein